MLLGKPFAQFVKDSPISVMMRGVVEYAFEAKRLNVLFEDTAEAQYTRTLHFSTVADLMSEVVFDISPSIGAAYQANIGEMTVSRKSVYNKLNGIEPRISAALVEDSVTQFAPVIEKLRATRVFPCEDGHAQERSLLDQVLPCVEKGDLWIEDRNFCTLGFLFGIRSRGAKFLVRQHANLPGRLRGRRKYVGRIETGRVYEQSMEITDPKTGATLAIRRITVKLYQPTRDGDTELHILTNVPRSAANACKLAGLYRKRWTIETMFQELTETLTCEIKTLGYPKAAVFAFCLALVAYNGISVIKAALRSVHGTDTVEENVSGYYLSLEISKTYTGMMIAIPPKHWTVFRDMSVAQLARVLTELAHYVELSRYGHMS